MRLVPCFPSRKCSSYCKIQANVLFWTPHEQSAQEACMFSEQALKCGQKLLRSCGANGLSKVPLVYEKLHIWVKLEGNRN